MDSNSSAPTGGDPQCCLNYNEKGRCNCAASSLTKSLCNQFGLGDASPSPSLSPSPPFSDVDLTYELHFGDGEIMVLPRSMIDRHRILWLQNPDKSWYAMHIEFPGESQPSRLARKLELSVGQDVKQGESSSSSGPKQTCTSEDVKEISHIENTDLPHSPPWNISAGRAKAHPEHQKSRFMTSRDMKPVDPNTGHLHKIQLSDRTRSHYQEHRFVLGDTTWYEYKDGSWWTSISESKLTDQQKRLPLDVQRYVTKCKDKDGRNWTTRGSGWYAVMPSSTSWWRTHWDQDHRDPPYLKFSRSPWNPNRDYIYELYFSDGRILNLLDSGAGPGGSRWRQHRRGSWHLERVKSPYGLPAHMKQYFEENKHKLVPWSTNNQNNITAVSSRGRARSRGRGSTGPHPRSTPRHGEEFPCSGPYKTDENHMYELPFRGVCTRSMPPSMIQELRSQAKAHRVQRFKTPEGTSQARELPVQTQGNLGNSRQGQGCCADHFPGYERQPESSGPTYADDEPGSIGLLIPALPLSQFPPDIQRDVLRQVVRARVEGITKVEGPDTSLAGQITDILMENSTSKIFVLIDDDDVLSQAVTQAQSSLTAKAVIDDKQEQDKIDEIETKKESKKQSEIETAGLGGKAQGKKATVQDAEEDLVGDEQ